MNSWFRADRRRVAPLSADPARVSGGPGSGAGSGGNPERGGHVEADVQAQLNANPISGYSVLSAGPAPTVPLPIVSDPVGVDLPAGPDPRFRTEAQVDVDPVAERRAAVRLCLYALDRARSAGVVERLVAGLAEIGVVAIRPDGAPFDPSRHEAGGTVPTDDPALDGLVAETEVIGFADRGDVVRVPIVTVYTSRGGVR